MGIRGGGGTDMARRALRLPRPLARRPVVRFACAGLPNGRPGEGKLLNFEAVWGGLFWGWRQASTTLEQRSGLQRSGLGPTRHQAVSSRFSTRRVHERSESFEVGKIQRCQSCLVVESGENLNLGAF